MHGHQPAPDQIGRNPHGDFGRRGRNLRSAQHLGQVLRGHAEQGAESIGRLAQAGLEAAPEVVVGAVLALELHLQAAEQARAQHGAWYDRDDNLVAPEILSKTEPPWSAVARHRFR